MSGEYQTDIKFEDIKAGDVVVLEVFSDDNMRFIGDFRGTATHLTFPDRPDLTKEWHFDGMDTLTSDEWTNYRLFRVEPPSAEELERKRLLDMEAEFYRLRELKVRVTDLLAAKEAELLEKCGDLTMCAEKGWDEGHERITAEVWALRGEIKMLKGLLNG